MVRCEGLGGLGSRGAVGAGSRPLCLGWPRAKYNRGSPAPSEGRAAAFPRGNPTPGVLRMPSGLLDRAMPPLNSACFTLDTCAGGRVGGGATGAAEHGPVTKVELTKSPFLCRISPLLWLKISLPKLLWACPGGLSYHILPARSPARLPAVSPASRGTR